MLPEAAVVQSASENSSKRSFLSIAVIVVHRKKLKKISVPPKNIQNTQS